MLRILKLHQLKLSEMLDVVRNEKFHRKLCIYNDKRKEVESRSCKEIKGPPALNVDITSKLSHEIHFKTA